MINTVLILDLENLFALSIAKNMKQWDMKLNWIMEGAICNTDLNHCIEACCFIHALLGITIAETFYWEQRLLITKQQQKDQRPFIETVFFIDSSFQEQKNCLYLYFSLNIQITKNNEATLFNLIKSLTLLSCPVISDN